MSAVFAHAQDQKLFICCSLLLKKAAPGIVLLIKSNIQGGYNPM